MELYARIVKSIWNCFASDAEKSHSHHHGHGTDIDRKTTEADATSTITRAGSNVEPFSVIDEERIRFRDVASPISSDGSSSDDERPDSGKSASERKSKSSVKVDRRSPNKSAVPLSSSSATNARSTNRVDRRSPTKDVAPSSKSNVRSSSKLMNGDNISSASKTRTTSSRLRSEESNVSGSNARLSGKFDRCASVVTGDVKSSSRVDQRRSKVKYRINGCEIIKLKCLHVLNACQHRQRKQGEKGVNLPPLFRLGSSNVFWPHFSLSSFHFLLSERHVSCKCMRSRSE